MATQEQIDNLTREAALAEARADRAEAAAAAAAAKAERERIERQKSDPGRPLKAE